MKSTYTFLMFILLVGVNYSSTAQTNMTYINREWSTTAGSLGLHKIVASAIAPNGNLVNVTNHFNGSNTDIYLTCLDSDGNLLWTQTCQSSSTEDDYGTDVEIDASGNIYVIGTYHTGTDLDYLIAKYSSTGSLSWQQTYNGGHGEDIPSHIAIASNNDIVVTGASIGLDTLADFATLRLNSSNGNIIWSTRYDPLKRQVATSLAFDSNGDIFVTGSTFSTSLTSDIVTLKYNGSNGQQLIEEKLIDSGNGADVPTKIICDGSKVIIVGTMNYGAPDSDATILCYDNSLQLLWREDIDYDGFDDLGTDIIFDQSGSNVYVTGAVARSSSEKDLILASLAMSNGSENWSYIKPALQDDHSSEGRSLHLSSTGDVYLAGINDAETKDLLLMKFNNQGQRLWSRTHDNSAGIDEGHTVDIDGDYIYVFGASEVNGTVKASTTQYTIAERELSVFTDEETSVSYLEDNFIIEFNDSIMIIPTIDNKGIEYGLLTRFIDSAYLAYMSSETEIDWTKFRAYKVHRRATSQDTLSIARDGRYVRLDNFWSSLIVEIPDAPSEASLQSILGNINKVHNVQHDYVYEFYNAPNDTYYGGGYQLGLHPNTSYPNSDINVEDAWDIEVGKGFIKVGVVDFLIDWSHFEFGQSGTLSASKVVGGWDYQANDDISNGQFITYGHATKVAGIIGANRNDGAGVAGIAGGNIQNDPILDRGVELYSLGVALNSSIFTSSATIAEAITEGSTETTNGYGFGLHVQNHSYGNTNYPDQEVYKAIVKAHKNLSVFVAARGTQGNLNLGETNPPAWPACTEDRMVISVIASGTDGSRKDGQANGTGDWSSSFGRATVNNIPGCDCDFMAPGVIELISTTDAYYDNTGSASSCYVPSFQNGSRYNCFQGTSASAPMVTGVGSLMVSHHVPQEGYPNILGTEDVEEILQKTASNASSYTYEEAYGLIDAYEALRFVDDPYYVKHQLYDGSSANSVWVTNYSNPSIKTGLTSTGNAIYEPVSHADCYRFDWNVSGSLPQGHEIIDSWEFEACWNAGSDQASQTNFLNALDNEISYTSGGIWPNLGTNTYTAFASTYLYWVTDYNSNQFWYPFPPSELSWGFSLHVINTVLATDKVSSDNDFELYPNPTASSLIVNFSMLNGGASDYTVTDASGRIVRSSSIPEGVQSIEIDVNSLDIGMYYVTLSTDSSRKTKAFVKHE